MKILLVSTNRNTLPMPVMPIGACIIAHASERSGHTVHLLDLMFTRDATAEVESAVMGFQPDVVGLSVRNIDNNDMRNTVFFLENLRNIANVIRAGTSAPIFLGGAAMGVMPEEILRLGDVSGCVIGDGETIFPLLADRISQGGSFHDLPGVAYIENGTFHRNPPAAIGFSAAPFPCVRDRPRRDGGGDADALNADRHTREVHHREHGGEALVLLAHAPGNCAVAALAVDHRAGRGAVRAEFLLDARGRDVVPLPVGENRRHGEHRDALGAGRGVR